MALLSQRIHRAAGGRGGLSLVRGHDMLRGGVRSANELGLAFAKRRGYAIESGEQPDGRIAVKAL